MAVDEAESRGKSRSPKIAQRNRPGAAIAEHTLIWPMSWTGPCPPSCYALVGPGMPRPRCRMGIYSWTVCNTGDPVERLPSFTDDLGACGPTSTGRAQYGQVACGVSRDPSRLVGTDPGQHFSVMTGTSQQPFAGGLDPPPPDYPPRQHHQPLFLGLRVDGLAALKHFDESLDLLFPPSWGLHVVSAKS